jgi:integrase
LTKTCAGIPFLVSEDYLVADTILDTMNKPFYYKRRGAWYVKAASDKGTRVQVRLHEDEAEAYRIWGEMQQMRDDVPMSSLRLDVLCEHFLSWAKEHLSEGSFSNHLRYLVQFCNLHGPERAMDMRAIQLTKFVAGDTVSVQRMKIAAVKRVFSWGESQGLIHKNQFAKFPMPAPPKRDVIISAVDHGRMIESLSRRDQRPFRPFLVALKHSGARPGTIARISAADVQDGRWVIKKHKTEKKTRKPLVVHLTPCLETLTKIMLHARGSGPLFLNADGKPWKQSAFGSRMRRMRKSLGLDKKAVAYSYRHSYATNALVRGVPIATVAELLGHTGTKMVSEFYGHLAAQPEHLREAAIQATTRTPVA